MDTTFFIIAVIVICSLLSLIPLIIGAIYIRKLRKKSQTIESQTTSIPEDIQNEIDALDKRIRAHTLPAIRISPKLSAAPSNPRLSQFGGKPYWPSHMDYPHAPDGSPMFLLAQLNFEEMPPLDGYPSHGLLQFFVSYDDGLGYKLPSDENDDRMALMTQQDTFKVIYHETLLNDDNELLSHPVTPTKAHDLFPVNGYHRLTFSSFKDVLGYGDYRSGVLNINPQKLHDEVWHHLLENHNATGSKVGGYAHFAQHDPRHWAAPEDNWLLLFQMDSDESKGANIMWGDDGVGNFFIRRDDLLKKDFSHVMYYWDCY